MSSSLVPLKTRRVGEAMHLKYAKSSNVLLKICRNSQVLKVLDRSGIEPSTTKQVRCRGVRTAMASSDVVQSGRPIFDDFFQHLWPYIGNNTVNVVFQMVKRLWLNRIDQ
ncbi:hypothetical protein TNCV_1317521 [Trichonephila clavipes]|nr:hypothetical protein TNCV_1317521 [Trichonephila clavipes]